MYGWFTLLYSRTWQNIVKQFKKERNPTPRWWFLFSSSVMSKSLQRHGLQHARPPCSSPTPRVYSNSCPSNQWCHQTISSSVVPFSSRVQSFQALGSFQMSQAFASDGQRIGVSASTSVLPMNTQEWSPLGWYGWISLQSKGLSSLLQHHSWKASVLRCSALLMVQLSHPYTTPGKIVALTMMVAGSESSFAPSTTWGHREGSPQQSPHLMEPLSPDFFMEIILKEGGVQTHIADHPAFTLISKHHSIHGYIHDVMILSMFSILTASEFETQKIARIMCLFLCCAKSLQSCLTLCDPTDCSPTRLLWGFSRQEHWTG